MFPWTGVILIGSEFGLPPPPADRVRPLGFTEKETKKIYGICPLCIFVGSRPFDPKTALACTFRYSLPTARTSGKGWVGVRWNAAFFFSLGRRIAYGMARRNMPVCAERNVSFDGTLVSCFVLDNMGLYISYRPVAHFALFPDTYSCNLSFDFTFDRLNSLQPLISSHIHTTHTAPCESVLPLSPSSP